MSWPDMLPPPWECREKEDERRCGMTNDDFSGEKEDDDIDLLLSSLLLSFSFGCDSMLEDGVFENDDDADDNDDEDKEEDDDDADDDEEGKAAAWMTTPAPCATRVARDACEIRDSRDSTAENPLC